MMEMDMLDCVVVHYNPIIGNPSLSHETAEEVTADEDQ